ncbi:hypothetical protein H9P43_000500 [Blastocladiella emersonii ATCC 22665]|nr:hypothetical protein H9P43_000500 [Blastocladiella emersonii ATCC 22665]
MHLPLPLDDDAVREAVLQRAQEIQSVYTAKLKGSNRRDPEMVYRACVKLACQESGIGLDHKQHLQVRTAKQETSLSAAVNSIKQNVPGLRIREKTFGDILIKLGAALVDRDFIERLAESTLAVLRQRGELNATQDESDLRLGYQCAALFVLGSGSKNGLKKSDVAKTLGVRTDAFDLLVARLRTECADQLKSRLDPSTPAKSSRKRARTDAEGEEENDPATVASSTPAPPPLSARRPLSNVTSVPRPAGLTSPGTLSLLQRTRMIIEQRAAAANSPRSALDLLGVSAPASSEPLVPLVPETGAAPGTPTRRPSTRTLATPSRTPMAADQPADELVTPRPAKSARKLVPVIRLPLRTPRGRTAAPAAAAPDQSASVAESAPFAPPPPAQPLAPAKLVSKARRGVGFYHMIPLMDPRHGARFAEYLAWKEQLVLFTWSNGAFIWGFIVATDLGTSASALASYYTSRSRVMLALAAVSIAHALENTFISLGRYRAITPGLNAQGIRSWQSMTFALLGITSSWIAACGIVLLNGYRLWRTCRQALPRAAKVCLGAAVFSASLKTLSSILFIIETMSMKPIAWDSPGNVSLSWFSILDSIINACISSTFLFYLRSMTGGDNDHVQRQGLSKIMLLNQAMLAIECFYLISVNFVVQVIPDFDPMWGTLCLGPIFVISTNSYIWGFVNALDIGTCIAALTSFAATKSKYMLALAIISAAHALESTCIAFARSTDAMLGLTPEGNRFSSAVTFDMIGATASWIGAGGIVLLNGARLWTSSHKTSPRAAKVSLGLAVASAALKVISCILFYVEFATFKPLDFTGPAATLLPYWSFMDAVIQAGISSMFLYHLRVLMGDQKSYRGGLLTAVRVNQLMLVVECSCLLAANLVVIVINPDWDPSWGSLNLAESLRLRVMCSFLQTLREIMSRKVKNGTSQRGRGSSSGTESSASARVTAPTVVASFKAAQSATGMPTLVWSTGCFTYGINLTADSGTLLLAYEQFRSTKSWYMAGIMFVCFAHMMNTTSRTMSLLTDAVEGVAADGTRHPRGISWDFNGATWAMLDKCVLVLLNGWRLYKFCGAAYPRISLACLGLSCVSALVKVINTVYFYVEIGTRKPINPVGTAGTLLCYWSMADAILNGVICGVFLWRVQEMTGNGKDGAPVFRAGLQRAIRESQFLLALECVLMLAANITVQVEPMFDPLWAGLFLIMSLRLRATCIFLIQLRNIMQAKNGGGTNAGSNSADQTSSATASSNQRGMVGNRMAPSASGLMKASSGGLSPATTASLIATSAVSPTSPSLLLGRAE